MKRLDIKYKLWKIRNDKKKFKIISKKNKKKSDKRRNKTIKANMLDNVVYTLPENFSILNNSDKTIECCNTIIDDTNKIISIGNKRNNLHIDMSNVKYITIDALMYLLAIIKNIKLPDYRNIYWRGNLPKDVKVRQIVQESGFLQFFKTTPSNIKHSSENVEIHAGNMVDSRINKKICDFVIDKLKTDKKNTRFLYDIINELITNAVQHAYDAKDSKLNPYWYIFVECTADDIKFTFVDTGLGIPKTVTKRFGEKFKEAFKQNKDDWHYIESALQGKVIRTSTNHPNRGKGLPGIHRYNNKKIFDLTIISNYGYFNDLNKYNLISPLSGTVFYWKIKRNGVIKNDRIEDC